MTPQSSQQWCGSALRPPANSGGIPKEGEGEKIAPVIWQYQVSSIIHMIMDNKYIVVLVVIEQIMIQRY